MKDHVLRKQRREHDRARQVAREDRLIFWVVLAGVLYFAYHIATIGENI